MGDARILHHARASARALGYDRSRFPGAHDLPTKTERTPMMAYVLRHLNDDPDATFAEVKRGAFHEGFDIQGAIVYGNARRELGLAPMRKRPAPTRMVEAAAPGERRGHRKATGFTGLGTLVADLEKVVQDRDRYRVALEAIADTLRGALR